MKRAIVDPPGFKKTCNYNEHQQSTWERPSVLHHTDIAVANLCIFMLPRAASTSAFGHVAFIFIAERQRLTQRSYET